MIIFFNLNLLWRMINNKEKNIKEKNGIINFRMIKL